jgi:hypothetical protein
MQGCYGREWLFAKLSRRGDFSVLDIAMMGRLMLVT